MTRHRRDPRAERAARRLDGTIRPRFDLFAPGSPRLRRDPRADDERARVPGTIRHRLDRSQPHPPAVATARTADAAPAAAVHVVADPAFLVAVVPDAPNGRLSPHDRQLFGAARLLAGTQGAVVALVMDDLDELGAAGADRTVRISVAPEYDPDGLAESVGATLGALGVRHALFAESAGGGDLARRVAARLGEALFAGVEGLTPKSASRAARARRNEQRMAPPPRLLTLAADAITAHAGSRHEARPLELIPRPRSRTGRGAVLSAHIIPPDPAATPLAEAEFVVAAGNGITDFEGFRTLTAALGATPGASRVVCDAGLMPRAAQVGASGTVLEATCYLALGIAGAPQHLQGVAKCEHVIAVNTDLHAAMIERADLAVVADAQAVMPALLRLLGRGGVP